MSEGTFNIAEAAKAQKEYCKASGLPHFASSNGACWNCNKNIYQEHPSRNNPSITSGISVEKAKSQLVTGCPHCNRSYCD
ncbi:MAG: hypothetical protein ABS942_10955 [Solibacillus sp.]